MTNPRYEDMGPPVEILDGPGWLFPPADRDGGDELPLVASRELWTGCSNCLSPKHAGACRDVP